MSLCHHREAYLDRTLSPAEQQQFVSHAQGCADCSRAMQAWSQTEAAVRDWAEVRRARPVTAGDTEALMARARAGSGRSVPRWALAVAAVLLCVAVFWPEPEPLAPPAPSVAVVEQAPAPAPLQVLSQAGEGTAVAKHVLEVPSAGHLLVASGEDRLGLGERSRVQRRVSTGEWILDRGTAAFEVAPRKAVETFTVVVGDHQIIVVGTRFRVDRTEGLVVTVAEGEVEVRGPDGTWKVGSGQRFQDGELIDQVDDKLDRLLQLVPAEVEALPVRADKPKRRIKRDKRPPVDLDALRRRLVSGEVEPVRLALQQHLASDPSDVEAWKLLALAERKASNASAAAQAWLQVAERGSGGTAARAHYEAALLFQELGRHDQAIAGFSAFLANERRSNSLEAAGRLHLARSLDALGRRDEARAELTRIIENHQGTSAATQARQLLKNLER